MNKQQLASKIWAGANELRGKVSASSYKDYMNIALVLTKGNSLINVYFKKANESISKSVVKIYFCNNDDTYLIEENENNSGLYSSWID